MKKEQIKNSLLIAIIMFLCTPCFAFQEDEEDDEFEIVTSNGDENDEKPIGNRSPSQTYLYGVYNTSDQTLSLSTSFVVTTIRIYANNQLVIQDTAPFFIDQTVSYPLASYPSGCYRVVVTLDGGSCLQSTFLR